MEFKEIEARKKQIFQGLRELAYILGNNIPPSERLQLYAERLIAYDYMAVKSAIENCALICKFFPTLKEIVDLIQPPSTPQDEAEELVNAVLQAMKRFGRYNPNEAREFLGPLAWLVAERYGGWEMICNSQESDFGTMRAQLGRVAKSILANRERKPEQLQWKWQIEDQKIIQSTKLPNKINAKRLEFNSALKIENKE